MLPLLLLLASGVGWAQSEPSPEEPTAAEEGKSDKKEEKERKKLIRSAEDYVPPPTRQEWLVFPVVAQNPDVGVMVGLSGGTAHFEPNYDPYRWSANTSAIVSFRKFDGVFRLLMQKYSVGFDMPQLGDGSIRITPSATFQRVPNASYYGIGNASGTQEADDGKYYRYDRWLFQTGIPIRYEFKEPWSLAFAIYYRYFNAKTYDGSLLEYDKTLVDNNGDPILPDTESHHDVISAAGVMFDTRDWEIDPAKGMYHKTSLRYTFGFLTDAKPFAGWNLDLRFYQTLVPEHLVLAERFMTDIMWGDTPFYELDHAGAFPNDANIGGSKATRGIPEGRYRGQSKVLGNLELRSWIFGHMLGNTHVRAGLEAFVDTGRVWAKTGQVIPSLDGTGLGMKYGTGLGLRLGWGEYGVVRIDFAWSPDGDPTEPFGIYMDVDNTF